MKRILFIVSLIVLISTATIAQNNWQESIVNIFTQSGLPYTSATAIVQDDFGFIWVGTAKGLYKYDGTNLSLFTSNKEGKSLISNNVKALYYDLNHNLWIMSEEGGLCRYNSFTDKIDYFLFDKKNTNSLSGNRVLAMIQDSSKVYWIATQNGLDRLSTKLENRVEKFEFEHYSTNSSSVNGLLSNKITDLAIDPNGHIWCATNKGLSVFYPEKKLFYNRQEITSFGQAAAISNIQFDEQGQLWVASEKEGLWLFSNPGNFDEAPKAVYQSGSSAENRISQIILDHKSVWIAIDNAYLVVYDTNTKLFSSITNTKGLTGSLITCLFKDKSDLIWAAHENGVDKIKHNSYFENINLLLPPFNLPENTIIYSVLEDENNRLWIGTDANGLICYQPSTKIAQFYGTKQGYGHQLNSDEIYSLAQDQKNVYIGTRSGLQLINKQSGVISPIKIESKSIDINTMYLDAKKNQLWLGLMNTGLCAVDLSDYSYKFYTDPETIEGVSSNNDVKAIYIDKDDMIWLGTDYGLKIFNRKSNTYLRYRFESENKSTLSSNQVSCIYEDGNNVVWIGTWGGGLNKFERLNQKITQINPAALNGLQMNAITSDLTSNLWISTNNGLIKFQTKTLDCQMYDKNDGIVNVEFNSGAFYKNPKGILYFGGIDGVTYFQPNRVNGINANKVILINKVYSESNQISIDYTDLLKPIVSKEYSTNNLSIDYITINYSNPEKVQYAYYLEGYNKDWVATGSNHTAVFANLAPGTYYFHFKSSLGEGNWKESEQVLTVVIIPPFYRTWWFYLLLALCIGALSYYAYITRKKRLQFIKEREMQDQSAKMKQLFLANMSHEIRTPMNSVVGFTELLAKTSLTAEQSEYVFAISNSSANLLVLINDILDYSKLEALRISLNKQPFDIKHMVDKVYATLFLKAKEKKLRFLINIDEEIPKSLIGDEVRLIQILLNILNNAVKFTHSGYVSLDLKVLEKTDTTISIQFVISDTGIGISSDKLPHIFESFTQVNNDTSKLYGGTGLGLAISKQLIELQDGTIQVNSEINKGTQFYITLTFNYPQSTTTMPTEDNFKKGDKIQLPKDIKNEKLKILIAEDNQFNQLLVKNIINKNFPNFEVTIVENGLLVLEKMKTEDFDFILMDIQMPEMNGIEATKEIRNRPELYASTIPIIACTAGVTPSEIQNCYDAGMNDFIGKPFKPEELIAKIENLFNPK